MTTDMERELRELFREKAGEAPLATLRRPRGPRRSRCCGAAAATRWEPSSARPSSSLVLIVGSVAGLNAVLRARQDPFTTGDYDVFQRTATIEAFTVASPPTGTW